MFEIIPTEFYMSRYYVKSLRAVGIFNGSGLLILNLYKYFVAYPLWEKRMFLVLRLHELSFKEANIVNASIPLEKS